MEQVNELFSMKISKDNISGHFYINHSRKEKIDDIEIVTENQSPPGVSLKESLFFNDRQRKIDFILVFSHEEEKLKEYRIEFEKNLVADGLNLESFHETDLCFLKIHAPWEVLTRLAESIGMKMPLKKRKLTMYEGKWFDVLNQGFRKIYQDTIYDMAEFSRENEHMFLIEDRNTFFSNAQRSLLVYELLLRSKFDEVKCGIDNLIKMGVYSCAFPLHEGRVKVDRYETELTERQLLHKNWASLRSFYKVQPLNLIRRYFGEKVAIYFAWLGYYTYMLGFASVVGLVMFFYGVITIRTDEPSIEICNIYDAGNLTMCPKCDDQCWYWRLYESCTYSKVTHVFDNYSTILYSVFIVVWATIYLEFWKRREFVYQYNWGTLSYDEAEHVRPDFEIQVKTRWINPITQIDEPYMSMRKKMPRIIISIVFVTFMVCCVLGAFFGIITFRIIILTYLFTAPQAFIRYNAIIITAIVTGVLSLIVISILNRIYERIAYWLTDLENHRTLRNYENSFILKMFIFQFINYYAFLFYIAFFKGKIGGSPGKYDYSLGVRMEECDRAGCFLELTIQLAIVMVGKQSFNNLLEILWPKLMIWCRKTIRSNVMEQKKKRMLQFQLDYDLEPFPIMGLFDDYLEIVIQYGFITIFVSAFPLAPLFALVNNLIEIRVDAYKLISQWQRPVAIKAKDIGIWFQILEGMTMVAVITNAVIIGWTSEFIPRLVYIFSRNELSLKGYVESSLSVFNVSDFQLRVKGNLRDKGIIAFMDSIWKIGGESEKVEAINDTTCRYPDFRYPPDHKNRYEVTPRFWYILCARLSFIIVFEHLVFFLTWFVQMIIPDIPSQIKSLIEKEGLMAKEARFKSAYFKENVSRAAVQDKQ